MVSKVIDLFTTCFRGNLFVKIIDVGELKIDSSTQEKPLAWFVTNAASFLTKETQVLNRESSPWEVVSFSGEQKKLVVKKKN